jgi:predicted glycoside hydrolase/deacetylase ChbG (UPF0249 family)
MKNLIINADDFGYSKVFNKEILKLIEEGLVLSTTVMVDWIDESQEEQVKKLIQLSKENKVGVGLHLELNNTSFRDEILRQYRKFKEIFNFEPSHIDLHKWAYLEDSYPEIQKFCKEKNFPCRNDGIYTTEVKTTEERVFSSMNKSFEEIESWVKSLEDDKNYEILFHPGIYDPDCKSSFNKERENDIKNIRKLNGILVKNNIQLINFKDL